MQAPAKGPLQVRPVGPSPRVQALMPEGHEVLSVFVRTSNLLKKTYREARGETVIDEEDKVMRAAAHAMRFT